MTAELREFLLDRSTTDVVRWHHRPVLQRETVAEHHALTARTAFLVASLLVRCGWKVNPERIAVAALFHDEPETITGDIPGDQKRDPSIGELARYMEHRAVTTLVDRAPIRLQKPYGTAFKPSGMEADVVKYADDLAALAFLEDEMRRGNTHPEIARIAGLVRCAIASRTWPWLRELREKEPGLP